jgi:hypothetical protein
MHEASNNLALDVLTNSAFTSIIGSVIRVYLIDEYSNEVTYSIYSNTFNYIN